MDKVGSRVGCGLLLPLQHSSSITACPAALPAYFPGTVPTTVGPIDKADDPFSQGTTVMQKNHTRLDGPWVDLIDCTVQRRGPAVLALYTSRWNPATLGERRLLPSECTVHRNRCPPELSHPVHHFHLVCSPAGPRRQGVCADCTSSSKHTLDRAQTECIVNTHRRARFTTHNTGSEETPLVSEDLL